MPHGQACGQTQRATRPTLLDGTLCPRRHVAPKSGTKKGLEVISGGKNGGKPCPLQTTTPQLLPSCKRLMLSKKQPPPSHNPQTHTHIYIDHTSQSLYGLEKGLTRKYVLACCFWNLSLEEGHGFAVTSSIFSNTVTE